MWHLSVPTMTAVHCLLVDLVQDMCALHEGTVLSSGFAVLLVDIASGWSPCYSSQQCFLHSKNNLYLLSYTMQDCKLPASQSHFELDFKLQ